ncbi:hypothetical protein B0H21DRAFT_755538 [Amylocystis lapponica]|nr:hypothetical protein B0H21DRAFT_755538 [Amylocystis lapponica]
MSANNSTVQETIADSTARLVVENYCIIASTALLFFDWAITLTAEVPRIWCRKISGVTVIFLLNRYVALAERITFVTSVLIPTLSNQSCVYVLRLDDSLTTLGAVISSVFIVLRVWGIWGKDWRPHILLIPLVLVSPVLNVYFDANYIPIAFGPPLYGCGALFLMSSALINRCILSSMVAAVTIAATAILLILTWIKTFGIKRHSMKVGVKTPLVTLILRDGTFYFLIIMVVDTFQLVGGLVGSDWVVFRVWTYFEQVFHVIFLSRFMLDLRGVYLADDPSSEETEGLSTAHATDIHFASHIVGNMGAPLETGQSLNTEYPLDEDDGEEVTEYLRNPFMAGLELAQDENKSPVSA